MANSPNRNRIIYQSLAVFASQVAATGVQTGDGQILQIPRVQSWDDSASRNLTDVTEYGTLAPIDRLDLEAPTVNASFSYYTIDGIAEKYIGLTVVPSGSTNLTSCISGILNKTTDEKNYYLLITEEGYDANGYVGSQSGVIGVGNGTISNYNLNGAVGEILTATVDLEALNIAAYSDVDGTNDVPAVNRADGQPLTNVPFLIPSGAVSAYPNQISAIQPGDITLTLSGAFPYNLADLKVQSFSLDVPLSRTPIQKLGSRFPFAQEIEFPATATLSVDAEFGSIRDYNLATSLCSGEVSVLIRCNKPNCGTAGSEASFIVLLRGAKVVGNNLTTSIGPNASATLNYEVSIGGATDLVHAVILSGSAPTGYL